MKKYLQISTILIVFFAIVIYRNTKNSAMSVLVPSKDVQNTPTPNSHITSSIQKYRDGVYTGDATDAYYGIIQIKTTIVHGKITDITFLQYPNDNNTSRLINEQAMVILKSEAIQAQNAHVDIVTGASDTSEAFQKSLDTALQKSS